MSERCRNIYRLARNTTGLTQEVAAKKMNISVRSLIDYETDKTVPNVDIVLDMILLYGTKWLGYEHFRLSSQLGMEILPPINIKDLAQSVLLFEKESTDVDRIRPCMIEIASNSRVDDHQVERWKEVSKEIFEMAGAAFSVYFSS